MARTTEKKWGTNQRTNGMDDVMTRPVVTTTHENNVTARPWENMVTPDQRHKMIAEHAYYKAEKRGFHGGDPRQDWYEAEHEVDALLMAQAKTSRMTKRAGALA